MRIAFIAPYQGSALAARRPIEGNLSLGARTKINVITTLLKRGLHSIEILSQGEVVERGLRYYPGFTEETLSGSILVHYSSAFPVRFVNGLWSSIGTLRLLKSRHRVTPFDLVIIYNLKPPQVACARFALSELAVPVILEYEDDHFLEIAPPSGTRFTSDLGLNEARRLLTEVTGCVAGSMDLLGQVPPEIPRLLLPGVVSDAIAMGTPMARRNWVVFSGTHSHFQGLEQLITAWRLLKLPDWELHIAGHGAATRTLHTLAAGDPSVVFHGILDDQENATLLASAKFTVVPYDVSKTRGFSFKTIECLAAGLHVITTRLTALDSLAPELVGALTYLDDNAPEAIAAAIRRVVAERHYEQTSREAAIQRYGPSVACLLLKNFLDEVMLYHRERASRVPTRTA